jgi:hypothetical protein
MGLGIFLSACAPRKAHDGPKKRAGSDGHTVLSAAYAVWFNAWWPVAISIDSQHPGCADRYGAFVHLAVDAYVYCDRSPHIEAVIDGSQ